MVPRTAEARVQWVLSALKSIPAIETLEAAARALVTIPLSLEGPVRWNSRISWLSHNKLTTIALRDWLMKRPWQCYQAGSQKFLGYEQAWDTLLAALVYCKTLHLESSVGRNQPIGEDDDCNAPMMLLQNELGAIQPVIQEMLDMITHLTKLFSWPASLHLWAYLHTLWDYGPYHELIRLLASCLASSPTAHTSSREFGTWNWPRCGAPNDFHSNLGVLSGFLKFWDSEDALFNAESHRNQSMLSRHMAFCYRLACWRTTTLSSQGPVDQFPPPLFNQNSLANPSSHTVLSQHCISQSFPTLLQKQISRRNEGHANYNRGLKQRKINRDIRSAARQDRQAQKATVPQLPAPVPDAEHSPDDAESTGINGMVPDHSNTSKRRLRKRKHKVIVSESEAEDQSDDSAGPSSRHTPTRETALVARPSAHKSNFVVLLSPIRRHNVSLKQRDRKRQRS
ncbi:hypothetical protein BC826DRAFT_975826 [Russula brevipes]|nr:hypothetical protein BC826DRAFT_975826 [Russula brevipes]